MALTPVIPETITVHLAGPDTPAENVTVSFPDYIKNVASSEIYPTWPESALRANIYAIITYALNRVYTEWYRSRGYNFDITNSTAYDQAFSPGRDIFENISQIVDEIFNDYVRMQGSVEPYFTQFCNGTTVTCPGLSQWGTVTLANQGLTPFDILRNYYGDNIEIVQNAPIAAIEESYPGTPLRVGDVNNEVKLIQVRLNRISKNWPLIPKINTPDGTFDRDTYNAVRKFQEIFNLDSDGVVGKATWYRILYIYNSVKRLSELNSEGLQFSEISQQFGNALRLGDRGSYIEYLQYLLSIIGDFNDSIPPVEIDGIYGSATEAAVTAFQREYGLTPDGIVGEQTWNELINVFDGIVDSIPQEYWGDRAEPYPNMRLLLGMSGPSVSEIQTYLSTIADVYPSIPKTSVTGYFGEQTQNAVAAFQRFAGLDETGIVNAPTWAEAARLYSDILDGREKATGQFPGGNVGE